MFAFFTGNFRLYAVVAVALAVLTAFWYISGLRADLAQSEANNQLLKSAVNAQQETIEQLQKDANKIKDSNNRLTATVRSQNKELDDLRKRLKEKDLSNAAVKNPANAQQQVNQISKNLERCLEIASGSPLTEREKNAKTINEINTECPGLANPSYRPTSN